MLIDKAAWTELSLVSHGAFGASASITDVAASIPTSNEEMSDNTKEEADTPEPLEPQENPVSETPAPEVIEAAAPLFATPKRQFVMPSAAEYMAAMHVGGQVFENVNKAFKENLKHRLLDLYDLQQLFKVTRGTIHNWIRRGLLSYTQIGGKKYFDARELEELLEKNKRRYGQVKGG